MFSSIFLRHEETFPFICSRSRRHYWKHFSYTLVPYSSIYNSLHASLKCSRHARGPPITMTAKLSCFHILHIFCGIFRRKKRRSKRRRTFLDGWQAAGCAAGQGQEKHLNAAKLYFRTHTQTSLCQSPDNSNCLLCNMCTTTTTK